MSMLLSSSDVLSLATEIERSGGAFYRAVAGGSSDASLRELFTFLASEEARHEALFRSLGSSIGELDVTGEEWEEISRYITATAESRFFVGEERAIQAAREASTTRAALDAAIGFEKDTLLFFHELLAVAPARSRDAVRAVVEEERRHVLMLSERRKGLPR
jgi:rubrerythrin